MTSYRVPPPTNEPILEFAPGSPERAKLEEALKLLKSQQIEIPMIIDGNEVKTDTKIEIKCPHDLSRTLGYYYQGGETEVAMAVESALEAQKSWSLLPWEQRSESF